MPIEDGFNKQEKEARWGNNPDTWMVALTAVLMLVGVGTAFVFYGQFSEMSAQTKILSAQAKQAHDDSIDADVKAKEQLDLVAKQVKAAQESVIAIQRQMRQDQRAWINIEFGTFHWAANEPLGVPMTLINTGKTPAKSISGQAVLEKVARGQMPHFAHDQYPTSHFGAGLMVPNAPDKNFGFQSLRFKPNTKENEPLKMSVADSVEIGEGRAYVAIHGIIRYKDIFATPHWIKFCAYSGALVLVQGSIKPCTDYNDADNN